MPKLNQKRAQSVAEASSSFPLIPEGVWPAKLLEVESRDPKPEPGKTKSGYWRWEFEVHYLNEEGKEKTGKQWDNTSLAESAEWRLKQQFEAFGVPSDTDTDDLLGKWVGVHSGVEIAGAGARKGEPVNTILKVVPITDEITESAISGDSSSTDSADAPNFEE